MTPASSVTVFLCVQQGRHGGPKEVTALCEQSRYKMQFKEKAMGSLIVDTLSGLKMDVARTASEQKLPKSLKDKGGLLNLKPFHIEVPGYHEICLISS